MRCERNPRNTAAITWVLFEEVICNRPVAAPLARTIGSGPSHSLGMQCRKRTRSPPTVTLRLEVRSEGTANRSARLAHSERVARQAPVADDAQRAVRVLTNEQSLKL